MKGWQTEYPLSSVRAGKLSIYAFMLAVYFRPPANEILALATTSNSRSRSLPRTALKLELNLSFGQLENFS